MCQCGSWKKSWGARSSQSGDSTGGRVHICRGDDTAEQIVDVPIPQIQEQNVEVIKVILLEQCQQMFFFLSRACGEGLWAAREERAAPQSLPHARVGVPQAAPHVRSVILSASDGIWNMLFSTYSHTKKTGKIKFLLQSSLSLVVAQASAICLNFLYRLPNCLLSVLIMCAAVSEEAMASDILVSAQPRIMCWARARYSSSEFVGTATARRRQRVEDAARVGPQFPWRSERRGRGAPSVATKWRDAVKAAIMHGPLPPDVTLDVPH